MTKNELIINRLLKKNKALRKKNREMKELVDEMSDYFPACIGCEGKTEFGERTDKCVYLIDNTNYCAKRGIANIASTIKENRELKAEIEKLKKEKDHFANIGKMVKENEAEIRKVFAEELIQKIVNTPTEFPSSYHMYRTGIEFRQNEIIDIIREKAHRIKFTV
ncbi:MAG: hypothetical protein II305_02765 [Clostridia bacterium]|nr:hypothetical protein [Clostridia bacterium]